MSREVSAKVDFFRKVFGSCEMSRDGANAAVPCPSKACKGSQKKKLAIRLSDDLVNCWVCGLHGRLIKVLSEFSSQTIVQDYVKRFAKRDIRLFQDAQAQVVQKLKLPEGFKLLAPRSSTTRDVEEKRAIKYLKGRGLSVSDMWYFKLGVAQDPDMSGRVIMPSFDASGELNFYTGRAIDDGLYRKYWNSSVDKKAMVFNELNIDWKQELTLVEGPFDLVKCDPNATCLLGSSLSEDSLLFGRIYQNMTPVVLAMDNDMQAKMWQRVARMLAVYDIPVRMLSLGSFKDVGEMTKSQFLEAKSRAVPWDRTSALRMKISSMGS